MQIHLLILLLNEFSISLITSTHQFPNDATLHHARRRKRVVGGQDSVEGEFPFMASIRRSGRHYCGGVLIAKRWILTAGHCIKVDFKNFEVKLGTSTIGLANSNQEQLINVESAFRHEKYAAAFGDLDFDIGLLR